MCINDDRLRTDHPSEARTLTSDFMLLNIQFYEWYFVYQFVVDILSFIFLVIVLSALLRYTASDYMYTFGIVKHFSIITDQWPLTFIIPS